MDASRRRLVQGGFLLGASSTLQGCALFDILTRGQSQVKPITCNDKTNPVVDAHAHFFNGTDLLAGPYLTGPVVGDLVNYYNIRLIRIFMKLTGRAVQRLARVLSITASDELAYLESSKNKLLSEGKGHTFSYNELGYKETSEAFYEALTKEEKAELQQAILEYENQRNAILEQSLTSFELKSLKYTVVDRNLLFDAIVSEPYEEKGDDTAKGLVDKWNFLRIDVLAAFVLRMLTKRSSNLAEFQSVYSIDSGGPSVINTTDITVDFDYWLGDCEDQYKSSIHSQVKLHEKLHLISRGYTIPILGVNPMKLISKGHSYLDFIEDTLRKGIYRGVKIYPTHGFAPNGELYENVRNFMNLCDASEPPNEKSVQSALIDIYNVCKNYDAVVMAHSDKSKGFPKNAAEFGGPKYWKKVFAISGLKDLKVNFGHLGEFKSSANANWTSEFLELMSEGNRYGDLGFWFTRDSKALTIRLFKELKRLGDSNLYKRILYGSDWFMLTSKPDWKPYLKRADQYFDEIIDEDIFANHYSGQRAKNEFFYQNAKSLYGNSVSGC